MQRKWKTNLRRASVLLFTAATAIHIAPPATAQLTGPPPKLQPSIVEIGDLGSQLSVSLKVGDTLRIVLASNSSTGYSWKVANKSTALIPAVPPKNAPAPPAGNVGAAGTQTLAFTAKSPGQDHLVLQYIRPWEKNTPPARTYSVDISIIAPNADTQNIPSVTPAGTLLSSFVGNSPCGDCGSIRVTIAFYAPNPQSTATLYVRTMTYLGAAKGNLTSITAGILSVKDDPAGTVYSLRSNQSDQLDKWSLQDNTLIPLGPDGNPIQSPFSMSLRRQH